MTAFVTILICAILQTVLAGYAGAKLVYELYEVPEEKNSCDIVFCNQNIIKFKTITTGSYLMYTLLAWGVTNIICTWVNAGASLPLAMHLPSYVPIPAFVLGLGFGYAMAKTLRRDYTAV